MAKRELLVIEGARDLREMLTKEAPDAAMRLAGEAVFEVAKSAESSLFRRLQNLARTGKLAFSLFSKKVQTKDGIAEAQVRGGATRPILIIREFGTSNQQANPAIGPAAEEMRPLLPALYKQAIGDKLAAEIKKTAPRRKG